MLPQVKSLAEVDVKAELSQIQQKTGQDWIQRSGCVLQWGFLM